MIFGKAKAEARLDSLTTLLENAGLAVDENLGAETISAWMASKATPAPEAVASAAQAMLEQAGVTLEDGETIEQAVASFVAAAGQAENLQAQVTQLTEAATTAEGRMTAITDGIAAAGIVLAAGSTAEQVTKSITDKVSAFARERLAAHGITTDEAPEQDADVDPLKGGGQAKKEGLTGLERAMAANAEKFNQQFGGRN